MSGRLWRRLWEMSSLLSFSHIHVMSAGRPGGGREGGREGEGGREKSETGMEGGSGEGEE